MLTIVKHSQRLGTLFRPWIGALALALSACAPDISGAYVARGENLVLMLQVVVTPDNQLSGTLHQVSLKPDGGVETFTAALTGVVSGGDIAMTMRPNGYFTTNVNLSATHAPGVLNVTWMGRDRVSTSTLRQGRVRDFTRHAEELQQRGNAIRAEKAEQRRQAQARRAAENRRTRMTALTADLEQAAARHVESISRVTQRETSFKEATVQMSQWLSQWRNAPQQSNARGNLRYRIRSLNQDVGSAELNMDWSRNEFEARSQRLLASVAEHQAHCSRNTEPACAGLTQAAQRYRRDAERLRSALTRADATIAAERAKREQIVAQLD